MAMNQARFGHTVVLVGILTSALALTAAVLGLSQWGNSGDAHARTAVETAIDVEAAPNHGSDNSILVSYGNNVFEYSRSGTQLEAVEVPYPGGRPATEVTRDITVDQKGRIAVYNGTFAPFLSTYDSLSGLWTHHTYGGWETMNNAKVGGIGTFDKYVYVTDMFEPRGIIRFNIEDYSAQRLGTRPFGQLNIGLDGLLYALDGSRIVYVYDPLTLEETRRIELDNPITAIAVSPSGEIFGASGASIYHFDRDGRRLMWVTFGSPSYTDIDISLEGELLLGSTSGDVVLGTESLDAFSSFHVGHGATFVSFNQDIDGDAILDFDDACPLHPGPVTNDGCPPVYIDIKPGNDRNSISIESEGSIAVAILSSAEFDAPSDLNQASLTFGRTGNEESLAFCRSHSTDVNRDGFRDQVCYFDLSRSRLGPEDAEGILRGRLVGDVPVRGTDSITVVSAAPGHPAPVPSRMGGNILVSSDDTLYEYTKGGAQVEAIDIPYGSGPRPRTEGARDLTLDRNGNVQVYNGTFHPFLSTYYTRESRWMHSTHPDWSTANTVGYGGIASFQNYIYVTDFRTSRAEASGIVRFDVNDYSSARFADGIDFIDLAIGLDGLLYGLYPGGSPSGTHVAVYDPLRMTFLRTVTLDHQSRAIAVNAAGEIFGATLDGDVHQFASDGVTERSAASASSSLTDIDVSRDGQLIIGSRWGNVILMDESLEILNFFNVGETMFVEGKPTHVAFATIQIRIDVRPGSGNNPASITSPGEIPVAILSSQDFDAPSQADTASLAFGRTGEEDSLSFCSPHSRDVNRDGLQDQICYFDLQDTRFQCSDGEGVLRGLTVDGAPIYGFDSTTVVPRACRLR